MSMEDLEKVKKEISKAEDRIRYYEQQDKIMRTLPELLMQYMDERRDERSDWSASGQRKGMNMDLKKVSHAIAFLQEHEIATTENLQEHLSEKEAATPQRYDCFF